MNAHNHRTLVGVFTVVILMVTLMFGVLPARSAIITNSDIEPLNGHLIHSGKGGLDLILFTHANGIGVTNNEIKEKGKLVFNGDDSNTDTPTGGITSMSESYITSIGDLRNFYRITFPDGHGGSLVNEIVLTVDVSQAGGGGGAHFITLDTLNVVVNYDQFSPASDPRNDPWVNDIDSATQNSTGSGFSGGTAIANLDPAIVPKTLDVMSSGSGWADYLIYTGIDPFDPAFDDETPILFFWESSDHHGGGTDIFISHEVVPEPGTMVLLFAGGIGMLIRRRRP